MFGFTETSGFPFCLERPSGRHACQRSIVIQELDQPRNVVVYNWPPKERGRSERKCRLAFQ